jgi:chromosome segregation ATPase
MKSLVAVLTVLIALLAFALWKSNASARAAETASTAALTTASNQLAEASMKLTHQEELAAVAQAGLRERSRDFAAVSNTVNTLKTDLAQSRSETSVLQSKARELRERLASAETCSSTLKASLQELTAQVQRLNASLHEARSNEQYLVSARAALANEAACLEIERVELARQLNDPHALQLRLLALRAGFEPLQLNTNGSVGVSAKLQKALRESWSPAAQ